MCNESMMHLQSTKIENILCKHMIDLELGIFMLKSFPNVAECLILVVVYCSQVNSF